jgi:hypothetical protein
MLKILTAALVIVASITVAGCGGSEEAVQTPTPTSDSILIGVPKADIDGSTNSDKMKRASPGESPAVSAEAAQQTALANHPGGGEVLETVLVDYTSLVQASPAARLVWVVNFDPATVVPAGPMGCMDACPSQSEVHTQYSFVLIDANSGEFIMGGESSYITTPTPTSS